jgi:hypothetical protein
MLAAGTATAGIIVDSHTTIDGPGGAHYVPVNFGSYDASGADKLVVLVGGGRDRGSSLGIDGVTYGGATLTEAVTASSTATAPQGVVAGVYYLDSPGAAGDLVVDYAGAVWGIRNAITVLELSGTAPGHGPVGSSPDAPSASLTTVANDSLVLAISKAVADGDTEVPQSPLTDLSASRHGAGYQFVTSPATVTPSFSGWSVGNAGATAAAAFAPAGGPPPSNLIGHYPLDTIIGGTTTPDTTGVNGPGTLNGAVTLSPGAGKIGDAFSFVAGNGNFVGIQDAGFGQDAFTASVWFQPTSIDAGDPVANWTNAGPSPRTFLIRTNGGVLQTYVRENGTTQIGGNNSFPTETLTTSDFNHAVITYDGQYLRTYLNGEISTSMPGFASPRPIGEGVQGTAAIGGRGSSEQNMNGLVDDVAFWNITLPGGHVAAIHNLAETSALNYNAYQANELFRVYSGAIPEASIGGLTWTPSAGLGGGAGDVVDLGGGNYFLNLDGNAGVATALLPVRYEVAGDNNIGTETWTGTQGNEVFDLVAGAKYVRVVQNLTETFQVAELQAFEAGTGINQAEQSQGGVATATSYGWGGVPTRANDGNTAGDWGSGTTWHSAASDTVGATLTVTLLNPTDLSAVHFWGRTDGCCDQRQNNFNLVISDELDNELYNVQHTGVGTSPGSNRLIDLSTLVSADLVAAMNPYDLGAGYTYVFELGSADKIEVANPDPSIFDTYLDLNNAAIEVELLDPSMAFALGDVFDLLDADFIRGSYHSLVLPEIGDGLMLYAGNFLKDGTLVVIIPEPATLSLLALGGLGLLRRRRRKG